MYLFLLILFTIKTKIIYSSKPTIINLPADVQSFVQNLQLSSLLIVKDVIRISIFSKLEKALNLCASENIRSEQR